MDLKGKVVEIMQTKQISEKFALREFVLETNDKYPQKIIIQTTQERCELLDNVTIGDDVQVFLNIRGREWTNPQGEVKYFNSLEAWKITNESETSFSPTSKPMGNIESNFMEDAINSNTSDLEDDGLPF